MVTRGGPFPDGSRCEPGGGGYWSTEDHVDSGLLPHYKVECAVITEMGFYSSSGPDSTLAPMCHNLKDQNDIIAAIYFDHQRHIDQGLNPLKLVIIDNILNIMGGRDGNSNSDVRVALDRFSNLAAELNICILGVAHTSKDHKDKGLIQGVMGTQSFVGIARVLMNVGKRYGETTGVIVRGKASNSSDYGGFEYTIAPITLPEKDIETTCIQWGDKKDGTAEELMKQYTSLPDPEQKDTTAWLENLLAPGKLEVKDIKNLAMGEGLSWYSVGKAASQLNIVKKFQKTTGQRGGGLYYWSLPEQATTETKAEEAKAPILPVAPKTRQTVQNNSYLAAKEGYMQ